MYGIGGVPVASASVDLALNHFSLYCYYEYSTDWISLAISNQYFSQV